MVAALAVPAGIEVGTERTDASPHAPSVAALVLPGLPRSEAPAVAFNLTGYNVTFVSVGLPANVTWFVDLTKVPHKGVGGNISIDLLNGSYNYTIFGSLGFYPASPNGTVVVNGSTQMVNVSFFEVFPLVYYEQNLPIAPESKWHVYLGGLYRESLAGASITWFVTNGTYNFSAGSTLGWTAVPDHLTVVVHGPVAPFNFTFFPPPVRYNVTFSEAGLPSGIDWQVTLDGIGLPAVLAPSAIVALEPNGTHTYAAGANDGYLATPSAADFTVNGATLTIKVVFGIAASYAVTFEPSGLVSGAWSVTVDGSNNVSGAFGTALTYDLGNGSYTYTVPVEGRFTPIPSSGTFVVAGLPVTIPIRFTSPVSPVTFVEIGLPAGSWWVNVNGTNFSLPAGEGTTLLLPNGSYAFAVGVNSGEYLVSIPDGWAYVAGEPVTITETVISLAGAASTPATTGSSTPTLAAELPYLTAGAAALVLALTVLVWRARSRPPPAPPSSPPVRPQ